MEDEIEPEIIEEAQPPLLPPSPGERLRTAREAKGMSIEEVAAETRIPQRHLILIEQNNFGALPARTYAIGFSRNFAKAVGLDEDEIAEDVRAELAELESMPVARAATFEPGDPARVPGGNVIWIAAAAVLGLLVIGYFGYSSLFAPAAELPSLLPEDQPTVARPTAAAGPSLTQAASGPVVFTSLEEGIWVKFYDANGTQLMQRQMAKGERYVVPADANGPQLWTGRPDALAITVGGRPIPRLATEEQIMKDVAVTPAALLARGTATPAASPSATPAAVARPAARAARPSQPARSPASASEPVDSAIANANGPATPTD